ncbi:MAG: DUF799 family lipoprotein [Arenicellales bacterium]|nr:DUF799 family lipoprotein [Arenicellales bacterium]
MINKITPLLVALVIAILTGCAVSTDKGITITPPLKTGKIVTESGEEVELPKSVAMLPFANMTDSDFAFTSVRRTMFNHFASKNYRMIHWQNVDSRLQLGGYEDAAALGGVAAQDLMNLLGVDGLIYGNITHYNKTFAGIYSQISVGVELKFINRDAQTVWEVKDVQRSHAGGLSSSPVGLLMNALAAANHLRGDINLFRTADELGRELAEAMPEPSALSQRVKPKILQVVHSGVGKYLKYGDTLEIALEGDAKLTAAARIEGIGVVDLEEQEPGQYSGKLAIDRKHQVEDIVVTGLLQDQFGQSVSWISPFGLLNIDNQPPATANNLSADAKDGAVQIAWQGPADQDVVEYSITFSKTERGAEEASFTSENASYLIPNLQNFQMVYVSITAVDKAGNISLPATLATMAAPDPRFGQALDLDSVFPAAISGINRLTQSGSPYYLRSNSRIAANGVLLVSPGVEIVVSPKVRLSVLGELQMYGDSNNLIRVVDENNQGFERFLVLQSKQTVQLQGLEIKGGGIPIEIVTGQPLISNSRIIDSEFNALNISGTARPIIRDCEISGAKTSGVLISGQAQPTFTNNRFLNNEPFHIQNGSTYQIDAKQNQWDPAASPTSILGDVSY